MKRPATTRYAKIIVRFEERADGGVRAYSDDVPGFVLSSLDRSALALDVIPALEAILSAMWQTNVRADTLFSVSDLNTDGPAGGAVPAWGAKEYVAHAA